MVDAVLEVSTTIAKYQAEMAKIPGVTDKMAAQAAIKLATRTQEGAKKASDAAAAAVSDVAKETGKAAADVGKAAKLAVPAMGELGEKVNAAVQGFTSLGPAGIIVGMGLVMTTAAAGAFQLGTALVDLEQRAFAATKDLRELAEVGVEIATPEQIRRVESAHWALEGVSTAAEAGTVILASQYAPALERVAVDLLALELAAVDAFNKMAEGGDLIGRIGDRLADVARYASVAADTLGMSGIGLALRSSANAWDDFGRDALGAAAEGLGRLEMAGADYIDQARTMIGSIEQLETKTKKNTAAEKEAEKALREHTAALEQLGKLGSDAVKDLLSDEATLRLSYLETWDRLDELGAKYGWLSDVGQQAIEVRLASEAKLDRELQRMRDEDAADAQKKRAELDKDLAQRLEAEAKLRAQYQSLQFSSAASLTDSLMGLGATLLEAQGATERKIWAWKQAGAYSQALVNAVLGISEASASAPFPWNLFPIAAQTAQGAAQVAAIAAVQAPQAYVGLDVPYASPQGTPVMVHPWESVMDRSEAERFRRVESGGGMTHVEIWQSGKRTADVVAEDIRRGGAVTAELSRRGGRLGRSTDYRST